MQTMILNLDHIALLVSNLSSVVERLPSWIRLDEPEEQASEGTLEQYAHLPDEHDPSLLILQPTADGPYSRAITKRGPGLHHFGFSTNSIDSAIDYFASCGLLLHPVTRYYYPGNAAWMCRPGVPFLVEIYTPPEMRQHKPNQIRLGIPFQNESGISSIDWIPGVSIHATNNASIEFLVVDKQFTISL